MATQLLMPKATAVWLVDNTALSFDQIAAFCKLHPLEVKAIADGESAQGIKGLDPLMTGQLSREEIARGEADINHKLKILNELNKMIDTVKLIEDFKKVEFDFLNYNKIDLKSLD